MVRALAVFAVLQAGAAHADALTAIAPTVPACDAQRAHCFGLQLHVISDAASTVAPAAWIAAQVALANKHFAASDDRGDAKAPDPQQRSHLALALTDSGA